MKNLGQQISASPLAKTILSIILTLGIVILLLAQIAITDLLSLFTDLSYRWIALGVLFYLATNVGHAFRLRVLLPGQDSRFHKLLPIVIAQSMFNNLLPARTGELSLLYLLKKYVGVTIDKGGVALIVARIIDYLAVATIFIIAAVASLKGLPDIPVTTSIIKIVTGTMVITVMILMTAVWWGQWVVKSSQWLIDSFGLAQWRPFAGAVKTLPKIIAVLAAIHTFRSYAWVFIWSLLLWLTTFAWFYAFLRGVGLEPQFLVTIVGATFAVLSKAIPFVSVGGLGTHEAGWTIGFMLVGFEKTTAIASGFAVNILTLITSIITGVCSLWILQMGFSAFTSFQKLHTQGLGTASIPFEESEIKSETEPTESI